MDDLINLYRSSLEDYLFSRTEKRELSRQIAERHLDKQQIAFLRSQIFNIARNAATPENFKTIFDWLEIANKTLLAEQSPSPAVRHEAYFSPGDECAEAIVSQLDAARSTLKICVFTISDNRLTESIIRAFRRGVHVRIISDNDKAFDDGSDIRKLARSGIDIRIDRSPHHMHHKFAIIDKQWLLTGSYNWTRSAALYNQENILITDTEDVVEKYLMEFKRLWEKMEDY